MASNKRDGGIKATEEWIRERIQFDGPSVEEIESLNLAGVQQEKIASLGYSLFFFSNLKVLDLSRNKLASLSGLENCVSLRKLNLYYNSIATLAEVNKLRGLSQLTDLDLRLNPVTRTESNYRQHVAHQLSWLQRLDERTLRQSEKERAIQQYGPAPGPLARAATDIHPRQLELSASLIPTRASVTSLPPRSPVRSPNRIKSPPRTVQASRRRSLPGPVAPSPSVTAAVAAAREAMEKLNQSRLDISPANANTEQEADNVREVSRADDLITPADLSILIRSQTMGQEHALSSDEQDTLYLPRPGVHHGSDVGDTVVFAPEQLAVAFDQSTIRSGPVSSVDLPTPREHPEVNDLPHPGAVAASISERVANLEQSSLGLPELPFPQDMSRLIGEDLSDAVEDILELLRHHDRNVTGPPSRRYGSKNTKGLRGNLKTVLAKVVLNRERECDRLRQLLEESKQESRHSDHGIDSAQLSEMMEERDLAVREKDKLARENGQLRAALAKAANGSSGHGKVDGDHTMLQESHDAILESNRHLRAALDDVKTQFAEQRAHWHHAFNTLRSEYASLPVEVTGALAGTWDNDNPFAR